MLSVIAAGLPDHVHQAPYGLNDSGNYHNQGGSAPHPAANRTYTNIRGYGKDSTLASVSNPIYGNNNTVMPPSFSLLPQIKF